MHKPLIQRLWVVAFTVCLVVSQEVLDLTGERSFGLSSARQERREDYMQLGAGNATGNATVEVAPDPTDRLTWVNKAGNRNCALFAGEYHG